MILKDKLGSYIYPGQIHGLEVVQAGKAPSLYPQPDRAAFAVIVTTQTVSYLDGTCEVVCISERGWVLAWFDRECLATAALDELLATGRFGNCSLCEIFEGQL